eukprot:COSAG01_NODE_2142_length_8319_cov_19.391653_8_plen_252_part_00
MWRHTVMWPQTRPLTIGHARLSCFDNRSLTAAVAACAFSSAATTSGASSAERGGGGGAGAGATCTREASATARPSSVGTTHPLAHPGPSKRSQRTCFQSIRPKQARGTRRRRGGAPAIFAPAAQLRRSSASFSRHRASACFTAASSAAWWSTAAASTAACMVLPGCFHPQFRVKSRRDIGKSQPKWTASNMETPGSPRLRCLRCLLRGHCRSCSPPTLVQQSPLVPKSCVSISNLLESCLELHLCLGCQLL